MQKEPEGKTSGFIFFAKKVLTKIVSVIILNTDSMNMNSINNKINSVRIKIWQR